MSDDEMQAELDEFEDWLTEERAESIVALSRQFHEEPVAGGG